MKASPDDRQSFSVHKNLARSEISQIVIDKGAKKNNVIQSTWSRERGNGARYTKIAAWLLKINSRVIIAKDKH